MFRRAAKVLVLHKKIFEKSVRWAGGDANVEILYNPVELDTFDPPKTPKPNAPPTVLMMGEIGERKGAFDLVQTIPTVLESVPTAHFRFAGNGETDALQNMANELGVRDHVDVMGWTSGQDKVDAFQSADLYCLPSYAENLPVSILEAMAARLPVISTPIAGTPEEVLEGKTGFLVQPGDKDALTHRLIQLLSDADLRSKMGIAGRKHAEANFDNEVVCKRLIELWESTR